MEIDFNAVERLPCGCLWCARWSEGGCIQAHFCEDFDWAKEDAKK